MPQNDGFNESAFEAHLNVIYPNRPTDIEPAGLDLFSPPGQPTATKPPAVAQQSSAAKRSGENVLQEAIDANNLPRVQQVNEDAVRVPNPTKAAIQAQAAKDSLAQEALLADPSEMRQLFPQLLKDMGLNPNGYLDMAEIDQALAQKQLSEPDMNFLSVLKAGYPVLSVGTSGVGDGAGVSATSLAMIDKAMNRSLKEDPIYASDVKFNLKMGVTVGAAAGAFMGRSSPETALIGAAAGVVLNTAFTESIAYLFKVDGHDGAIYDGVQKDYKTFVDNYDHKMASGNS